MVLLYSWVIKQDTGELTTGQLRREDAGQYTCIAENPAGRIEARAKLGVIIKPKVGSSLID